MHWVTQLCHMLIVSHVFVSGLLYFFLAIHPSLELRLIHLFPLWTNASLIQVFTCTTAFSSSSRKTWILGSSSILKIHDDFFFRMIALRPDEQCHNDQSPLLSWDLVTYLDTQMQWLISIYFVFICSCISLHLQLVLPVDNCGIGTLIATILNILSSISLSISRHDYSHKAYWIMCDHMGDYVRLCVLETFDRQFMS